MGEPARKTGGIMKTPQTLRPAMPNETPLSPAEIAHGVAKRIFTAPVDFDEWPVTQRTRPAGTWRACEVPKQSFFWSGL
jgi:hypothetical protein